MYTHRPTARNPRIFVLLLLRCVLTDRKKCDAGRARSNDVASASFTPARAARKHLFPAGVHER